MIGPERGPGVPREPVAVRDREPGGPVEDAPVPTQDAPAAPAGEAPVPAVGDAPAPAAGKAPAVGDDRPARGGLRSRLTPRLRLALIAVVVVTLAETVGFAGTYLLYSRHYVSTDNAQVDGDEMDVNAPAGGVLRDWTVRPGAVLAPDQVLGRIELQGASGGPLQTVRSPGRGTVALTHAVDGQWVNAGSQLAAAYDLDRVYLTARVADTDIAGVHLGARVTATVDAFPGRTLLGTVIEIQSSAAGEFTIYPAQGEDPTNPQKVDQYVPVKIALVGPPPVRLVPGMSVEVHIRTD